MKKRIFLSILIILTLILSFSIVNLLNINYIKQENGQVDVLGEKILMLQNNVTKVSIPHLNLKGIIKSIDSNRINIELADYAKTFLETTQITINNENFNLEENQRIILKFNEINIDEKNIYYSNVELYKLLSEIEEYNVKDDFYVCKNDFGGFMKVDGKSFKYDENVYFKSSYDLSENNEVYFVNVKNGILLVEEIKSVIFPFKIYNLINPQETRFYDIIEIYLNKRS